jgi:hypothetical protein
MKYNIEFLDKEQACSEFNQYTSLMQPAEIKTRSFGKATDNTEMHKFYCDNIMEFTQRDRDTLIWFTKLANKTFDEKLSKLKPNHWRFIKLKSPVDWDYPFTLNDCIVLTSSKLKSMTYAIRHEDPDLLTYFNSILIHEAIHVYQKKHPQVFDSIYRQVWKFIKPDNLIIHPWYLERLITNPDTLDSYYVFATAPPIANPWRDAFNPEPVVPLIPSEHFRKIKYYLPMLIMEDGKQKSILIRLKLRVDRNTGEKTYITTLEYRTTSSVPEYVNSFYGMDRQLYHPNEIIANLIADYAVLNRKYVDANYNSVKFYYVINRLFNR